MTKIYNTDIFHCKTLQFLHKLEFLVWKYTIWQPWKKAVRPKNDQKVEKATEFEP
jgi:hypothetical protein